MGPEIARAGRVVWAALGSLFHARCRACGAAVASPFFAVLCPACWSGLPALPAPACGRCALPGVRGASCRDCRRLKPAFTRAAAAAPFEATWRELCHAYKFEGRTSLRRPFARILRRVHAGLGLGPHAAVAHVPCGPETLRSRGFDHAGLLASSFARLAGIPWVPWALVKAPLVGRQSELGRRSRFANVRSAFRASLPPALRGRAVCLVDDILTTGATAHACAQALRDAGAARVDVLVLARSL